MDQDDPRIEYMSLEEAARPKQGMVETLIDYWWPVHPERGIMLFHYDRAKEQMDKDRGVVTRKWREDGAIQANRNQDIAERVMLKLYPWAEIRQLPLIFIPRSPSKEYA